MSGRPWTRAEIAILRRDYPHVECRFIAWKLKRSIRSLWIKSATLGLKKTHEFLSATAAARIAKRTGSALGKRFVPGQKPWNAGMKGLRVSVATEFKAGHRPQTWVPLGSERVTHEGYRQRKMTDTGNAPRDWVSLHVLKWQRYRGSVPAGHVVAFKDRDPAHIALSNLELISRAELMRRNSYHTNYPPEIVRLIQLRGAVQRQINKRERDAKQN